MIQQKKVKLMELNGSDDSGYILKVELMGYADGWDVVCKLHGHIPMPCEGP